METNKALAGLGVIAAIGLAAPGVASATVIGQDAPSSNCFPFGCKADEGTRYQQVYDADEFSGPIDIGGLEFFQDNNPGGQFNAGTFDFNLATTSRQVGNLDTSDFEANITGTNQDFATVELSGGDRSGFTVNGDSYTYDPAEGNLLLDIQVDGIQEVGESAFFDAYNGGADGRFSRAHDFGGGFEGYGLKTEFETAQAVPAPASLGLLGLGLVGFAARFRTRR